MLYYIVILIKDIKTSLCEVLHCLDYLEIGIGDGTDEINKSECVDIRLHDRETTN